MVLRTILPVFLVSTASRATRDRFLALGIGTRERPREPGLPELQCVRACLVRKRPLRLSAARFCEVSHQCVASPSRKPARRKMQVLEVEALQETCRMCLNVATFREAIPKSVRTWYVVVDAPKLLCEEL